MRIEPMQVTVYLAPTARRRYLTKRAAVRAEARALLDRKYPEEKGDETDGYYHWHWSSDDRLSRVYARLVRALSRRVRGVR